jgi:hypothetical protein
MAQEPSSKDLLEAVKQQESGGRRYKADGKTLLEGPQTKYGTAKGEMQVLDMTNKDPGYGVKPAQDNSPDERARVGRDYLNAMVKKYGDRETALVAYNWGPGNTDKWLKAGADPAKLPKETQNYVAKITASLGGTKVAAGPKADVPPRKTGTGLPQAQLLSQLGPNYQAAIAVSMLADEAEKEGKDEDAPSESEKMLAAMPSKPAPAVDLDLSYQSPFPEIQAQAAPVARKPLPLLRPVRMAEGGDPQIEDKAAPLEGTGYVRGADLPVSRSAKELKAYTEALNPAVETVTGNLGFDTRGYMRPSSPDTLNLNFRLTPAEREVTTLHELEHSMDARGGDLYGRPKFALMGGMDNNYRAYHLMGDDWGPIKETVKNMVDNREKLEKFFGRPLDNAYFRKDTYDNLNSVGSGSSPKALFSEQLASLSALEQITGKSLTQDPEMRELFPSTKMMAVYDALTGPRQTRMDAKDLPPHTPVPSYTYEQNPALRFIKKTLTGENEYGTSYRPFPIKRAGGSPETGEVGYFQDPMGVPDSGPVTADTLSKGKEFKAAEALQVLKNIGTNAASNLESILRGAVSQVPGVVGDLESGGRQLLNFSFGPGGVNVGEKTAAPTSSEIRARVPRITATRPESSGMESMGEMMAPGLAKAAAPVAKAAAKGTAKEMLRGIEGEGVLAPISPQGSIMYAVKPKGGRFVGHETSSGEFVDSVDDLIKSGDLMPDTRSELPLPMQSRNALNEWVQTKVGKYIRSDMATENDPFVKATDQGKRLHLHEDIDEVPAPMSVEYTRLSEGFPKQGVAKTELGKKVEAQIDSSMFPQLVRDMDTYELPPKDRYLLDEAPFTRVYQPGYQLSTRMQFPKMIEGMEDMLSTQKDYRAYGEFSSPIPEQYQLTPEKLQGLSPVQASEKVALFNQWRDTERQKQAAQYLDKYGNTYKKYDNGRKWIAMDDLAEEPMQAELAQQAGCLGGWCTRDESFALDHGSGENRLHILFDEKATPRVQLTVTKKEANADDFITQLEYDDFNRFGQKYGDINRMNASFVEDTPEFQTWARMQGNPERITELKGHFNKVDLAKEPSLSKYLKEVQDFVKSKDWGSVANLDGINMVDLDDYVPTLSRGLNLKQANELSDFMKSLNGGSRFADKYEGENIVREAAMRAFQPPTPPGRATGGMVERQTSAAQYI